MQVESIAECSGVEHSAMLLIFVKRLSVLKHIFVSSFERPLKTGFTVWRLSATDEMTCQEY